MTSPVPVQIPLPWSDAPPPRLILPQGPHVPPGRIWATLTVADQARLRLVWLRVLGEVADARP